MLSHYAPGSTIGYGVPDAYFNSCQEVVSILGFEMLCAILLDAIVIGTIFTRFSSGKSRAVTVLFSAKACLVQVKEDIYFIVQCSELRQIPLQSCTVRAYCFKHDVKGEVVMENLR